MTKEAIEKNYSWNQPLEAIYARLVQNPPDTQHYQKLTMLAQLKAASAGEDTAKTVTGYTKWLMLFTGVIVLCTVVQTVVAVFAYLHPPSH